MIWVLLIGAGALAAWLLAERLRRPMGRAQRHLAPGHFADLPSGATHYRWDGPVRGPVAVAIHGLTTGSYVMDEPAAMLARMGFRVLRYDLYGRGFSDRPGGAQDSAFFLRQLHELLDHQGVQGEVTLIGYSMGGAIATAFAADQPQRVDRLILLASAGLGESAPPLARFVREVPGPGDFVMHLAGGWQLRQMARGTADRPGITPDLVEAQIAETRYRGFLPAVLSSMRHMLRQDMAPAHRRIAQAEIPVLAIWAGADEVIPLSAVGRLAEINRAARQATLPGASHLFPATHPGEMRAAVQDFLRRG